MLQELERKQQQTTGLTNTGDLINSANATVGGTLELQDNKRNYK
jgi:hypothetical protein